MSKSLKARAKAEVARLEKQHGVQAASLGSEKFSFGSVPTGSLALDYALGTAGWPLGHPVEIFGERDIGKSSVLGLSAIRNAQEMGLLCGIIALEPGFDDEWAVKNGVDPDLVIVRRPDTGEEAFQTLHEWVNGDVIDFILFDSIGAVLKENETAGQREDGKAKPMQGGASGLITWGLKNCLMPVFKNKKGLILLNQIRADMDSRFSGQVKTPGGEALNHICAQIVHLKGAGTIKETVPGQEKAIVTGRDLVAIIERNKLSEGTKKRAEFKYYNTETEDHPVGIDSGSDITRTAIRTRVIIRKGKTYYNEALPDGKMVGKDRVADYLVENAEARAAVRAQVIEAMIAKELKVDFEPNDPTEEDGADE